MAKIWTWDGWDARPAPRYRVRPGEYVNEILPRREPIQFTVVHATDTGGVWADDPYPLQYNLQYNGTGVNQTITWAPGWDPDDVRWQKAREWWGMMGQYENGIKLSQFKFTDWKEVWK